MAIFFRYVLSIRIFWFTLCTNIQEIPNEVCLLQVRYGVKKKKKWFPTSIKTENDSSEPVEDLVMSVQIRNSKIIDLNVENI